MPSFERSPHESSAASMRPIEETETTVAYLGVQLEKATDRSNAPQREKYADYINDEFALDLQKKIATGFLMGDPTLIEGGSSIGKTTTVRKMCAELGYEVHYINFSESSDVETFMGKYIPNVNKVAKTDPQHIFADGEVTAGIRQEEGKIKVIIMDEINAASPGVLIRIHEVLDALKRGEDIVLSEDASEKISANKEKTKIIGLMNPPGQGYSGRNVLDTAQLRRWVYQKEVDELPVASAKFRARVRMGMIKNRVPDVPVEKFSPSRVEALPVDQFHEIPGMEEIWSKYEEMHGVMVRELETLRGDQPQPFAYDSEMEQQHILGYISHFYRGDINQTMQEALRYYYAGKVLDVVNRAKIEELIKHIEYIPPKTESKRRGLEQVSPRQGAAESLLQNPAIPNDIKRRIAALEWMLSPEDEASIEAELIKRKEISPESTAFIEAERIMGANFLGPKAIKDAFGIEVTKAPAIQFSVEELKRAQELGQQLILCVDKTSDGSPLTMAKMNELRKGKAADGKKLLYNDTPWAQDEPFFKGQTPVFRWRLTSPEVIPNSGGKDYIAQTQIIVDYLTSEVYKGKPLPKKYQDAIAEFQEQKAELTALLRSDPREAGKQIEALQITQLTREDASSVFYRLILSEKKSGKKSLSNTQTWTKTRSSIGFFVRVGHFEDDGVRVHAGAADSNLGACLSRS